MLKKEFKFREKFVAASFLIALIAFVLLHYYLPEHKNYAWLVFLLVPLAPFITGLKKITISYTMLVVIVYLILGFVCHWWHPGWVIIVGTIIVISIMSIVTDAVVKLQAKPEETPKDEK